MRKDIRRVCCTSVDDARSSLYHCNMKDLEMLKAAVLYEMNHGQRSTMIKMIKAKIRQLEKARDSIKG